MGETQFQGLPEAGLAFLAELAANNDREWFESHKADYESLLLEPAQVFVSELGERMTAFAPGLEYDTSTSGRGSILRIYRDVRFSKDKRPYHTDLRLIFWEGPWKKMENPSFFISIAPAEARLYAGTYQFNKAALAEYREAVIDDDRGKRLVEAIAQVQREPGFTVGGEHYKRIPRGYPADHERSDLLRYNGLHVELPHLVRDVVTSPALVDICAESFARTAPLHRWLVDLIRSIEG